MQSNLSTHDHLFWRKILAVNYGVIFGARAPILRIFCLHISPFLPTGTSHKERNQSKYAVTGWNQTYLPMTTHFGELRLVFSID